MRNLVAVVPLVLLWVFAAQAGLSQAKDMSFDERTQVDSVLTQVSKDVVKHYYDPKLHGVDWDAKVQQAHDKIKEEKSLNMAMAHVAALLDSLNDSHTYLIPPRRPYTLDHGWDVQMVGDKCYVVRVKPGGDAETHGVKPGDQLLAINGYRVGRENLWKIQFAFNVLRPLPQITATLRNQQGEDRKVVLEAKFLKRANLKDLDNPETYQDIEMEGEN
jgi:predicted metalloprotease with PDZ domain